MNKEYYKNAEIKLYLSNNKSSKSVLEFINRTNLRNLLPQIEFLTYDDLMSREDISGCCGAKRVPRLEIKGSKQKILKGSVVLDNLRKIYVIMVRK